MPYFQYHQIGLHQLENHFLTFGSKQTFGKLLPSVSHAFIPDKSIGFSNIAVNVITFQSEVVPVIYINHYE